MKEPGARGREVFYDGWLRESRASLKPRRQCSNLLKGGCSKLQVTWAGCSEVMRCQVAAVASHFRSGSVWEPSLWSLGVALFLGACWGCLIGGRRIGLGRVGSRSVGSEALRAHNAKGSQWPGWLVCCSTSCGTSWRLSKFYSNLWHHAFRVARFGWACEALRANSRHLMLDGPGAQSSCCLNLEEYNE